MPEYVRATDLDTGHKVTIFRSELDHGNYRELKADALNANGDPLPPELHATKPLSSTTEGHAATDKKES
jgi:hypothetical protein